MRSALVKEIIIKIANIHLLNLKVKKSEVERLLQLYPFELLIIKRNGFPDKEYRRVNEDCEGGVLRRALVKEINIRIANIHLLNLSESDAFVSAEQDKFVLWLLKFASRYSVLFLNPAYQ